MVVKQAFVLGAGLGTRLRPLTERLPKPMVPVFHRPLIDYAFDHLHAAGISRIMVNTHHRPEAYADAYPDRMFRGIPLTFRHEPVLLETGGGLRNIMDWMEQETLLVYNGDILSDLPLEQAIAAHKESGREVTMVLRSSGGPLQVAVPDGMDSITDIRGMLGDDRSPRFLFTGIYLVEPAFVRRIPPGEIVSVVVTFLEMVRAGELVGAVVLDDGQWHDVGTIEQYQQIHHSLPWSGFPRYADALPWKPTVDPSAQIASDATLAAGVVVGAGAVIEAGAWLQDCVLWPGARVAAGAKLEHVIVRTNQVASGNLVDVVV